MNFNPNNIWKNKQVFITGICGTVGKQILSILSKQDSVKIIGIDINESELFFLKDNYRKRNNIDLFYCDIKETKDMARLAKNSDYIIHTAALKHVNICENSPLDAIKTNVLGTQAIVDLADEIDCDRVLFTSTDKAVNPTNVMGTSKLLAERLMSSADFRGKKNSPKFISTRFGNVLGSHGSVIPLFKRQIESGGPITLTDGSMTRFIMTLEEATKLVLESMFIGNGGEVFVTKMPVIKIVDLAECMAELLAPKFGYKKDDIKIEIIGSRPGEKIYEELTNSEEIRRTIEMENFLCILPSNSNYSSKSILKNYPKTTGKKVEKPYNSSLETSMTKKELKYYLIEKKLV